MSVTSGRCRRNSAAASTALAAWPTSNMSGCAPMSRAEPIAKDRMVFDAQNTNAFEGRHGKSSMPAIVTDLLD